MVSSRCIASRRRRSSSAYTLLELCIVLMLISILSTLALPRWISWVDQDTLRREAASLQSAARTARQLAMTTQVSHTVAFTPAGWQIFQDGPLRSEPGVGETQRQSITGSVSLELHVWGTPLKCALQLSPAGKWVDARGFRWTFTSDGTSQPLRVRLATQGKGWMEVAFNPLTALGSEEASYFP
ncbi:MAG: GspH/FimT family pseudopilin [Candidatus Methylacidiphilales bacterium]|nr:GspH/FimT family protein [Candidatus Methylacidiphilales bacterium]